MSGTLFPHAASALSLQSLYLQLCETKLLLYILLYRCCAHRRLEPLLTSKATSVVYFQLYISVGKKHTTQNIEGCGTPVDWVHSEKVQPPKKAAPLNPFFLFLTDEAGRQRKYCLYSRNRSLMFICHMTNANDGDVIKVQHEMARVRDEG